MVFLNPENKTVGIGVTYDKSTDTIQEASELGR